ncbi:MAG: hypothetical protein JOZ02_02735 [Acidobacteria bacterium]|nr:hypothetical protein [Acidobacteriota bacterium]
MNPADYQRFLDELTSGLEADPDVVGLVALGSTADDSSRDRWSDHDFWVITAPGAQPRYLESLSWLPRAEEILLTVRHKPSGRDVLYRDGHKVEYIVFDPEEAVRGKIERYRVLIDRRDIETLAESIRLRTREERADVLGRPDVLENLCVLLWTAHERWERGERLSARQYIQFSIDRFLNVLAAHGGLSGAGLADGLDARRRLEQRETELGRELSRVGLLTPAEAGVVLLELARQRLSEKAPQLAWDKVRVVSQWLEEAGRTVS